MRIEVFNRYEKKYILDRCTAEKVQSSLSDYMEPDRYNKARKTYSISNLYYDTPNHDLIRTSLQKPTYKEKLRIRSYCVPKADDEVFVEIKKKVDGLVNKRRSSIRLNEAYEFLRTGVVPDPRDGYNRQVLREISYLLELYPLRPTLYLAYDRTAYVGIDRRDLRISFDSNIRTRRDDLYLESGDYGSLLLGDNQLLMEIKTSQNVPMWLSRLLSDYRIYPTSFSKYGTEYLKSVARKEPQYLYRFLPTHSLSRIYPELAVQGGKSDV